MTSVTPVTPETVTLWPEMFAMVTLFRWMYFRKTSAFRLARVQACRHGNRTIRHPIIHAKVATGSSPDLAWHANIRANDQTEFLVS